MSEVLIQSGMSELSDALCAYASRLCCRQPVQLIADRAADWSLTHDPGVLLLLDMAAMYETMEELLATLTLGRDRDFRRYGGKRFDSDAVSLMTMHSAKGLEFPVVFLCGLNDELIPYKNHGIVENPQEERRLFYVGITRARERLFLMTSPSPSVFLNELSALPFIRAHGTIERPGTQLRLFEK